MQGFCVDGRDVRNVFVYAQNAVSKCMNGHGPVLLECRVERWTQHVGPLYTHLQNCPIRKFENGLVEKKSISREELKKIHEDIDKIVSESFLFAREVSCHA